MNDFVYHYATCIAPQSEHQNGRDIYGGLMQTVATRLAHSLQAFQPEATHYMQHDLGLFPREIYNASIVSVQNVPPVLATAYDQDLISMGWQNLQERCQAYPSNNYVFFTRLPPSCMNFPVPNNFGNHGVNFELQGTHADPDTAMIDAGTFVAPLPVPGTPPSSMIDQSIPRVAKSRFRSRKRSSEKKQLQNWDKTWEPWRHIIQYLKLHQRHTFAELAFEMSSIHGFQYEASTYQKLGQRWCEFKPDKTNKESRNLDDCPRRRRAAKAPNKSSGILYIFKCKVHLRFVPTDSHPAPGPFARWKPYIHQYKLLHSIDVLVKGLFDQKGTYLWSANETTLFLSNQSSEHSITDSLATWQRLHDNCEAIALFYEGHVMKGTLSRLKVLFDQVLQEVDATNFSRDPYMLLYIWKICKSLMEVNPDKKYLLLSDFLTRLRQRLLNLGFRDSDDLLALVVSLHSILTITPIYFKRSLGLACWKLVEVLGSQIGNDHFITLNLSMYCNRNWGNIWGLMSVEELQVRYKSFLLTVGADATTSMPRQYSATEAESTHSVKLERVEALYASGLALRDILSSLISDRGKNQTRTRHITSLLEFTDLICEEIVALTEGLCSQDADKGKLKYTTTTRALSFALEQLAFDLQEKATTEEREEGKQRRKIRKKRNEGRKMVKLGQTSRAGSTSEATMTYSMDPDDMNKVYGLMDTAINILQKGDEACKLRAAQFSRQLMIQMRTYSLGKITMNRRGRAKGDAYKKERGRTKEILGWVFSGVDSGTKSDERKLFRMDKAPKSAKSRDKRNHVSTKPQPNLPLGPRTCRICGGVFESRNKLFELHINIDSDCYLGEPCSQNHQNPFMGYIEG